METEGLFCTRKHLLPMLFWMLTLSNTTSDNKRRERETGKENEDVFSEDLKQMETRRGRKLQKARMAEGEAHTPDCMKACSRQVKETTEGREGR